MKVLLCTIVLALHMPVQDLFAQGTDQTVFGTWKFIQEKSTNLATWRYRQPELVITQKEGTIRIHHNWIERKKVAFVDRYAFNPDGGTTAVPVDSEIWTDNWFMGVLAKKESERNVLGRWVKEGEALITISKQVVAVSQGETTLSTTREYRVDGTGKLLTLRETRSSRPTSVELVFERTDPDAPR
jgi:hypothetical protein